MTIAFTGEDPRGALAEVAGEVIRLCESIDQGDRSVPSARLLVAARVFAGAVELYAEQQAVAARVPA